MTESTTTLHYLGGCKHAIEENSISEASSLIKAFQNNENVCMNCLRIAMAQLKNSTPTSSELGGGKDFATDQTRKIPECRIYGVKATSSSALIKTATKHVLNGRLKEIVLLYRETVFNNLDDLNNAITSVERMINEQFAITVSLRYKQIGDRTGFKLNANIHIKYLPTLAFFLWKLVNIAYFDYLSLAKFNQMLRNQSNPSQRAYRSVLYALYTGDFTKYDFSDLFDQRQGSDMWQSKICGAYHRSVKNCGCGASLCPFSLNKPSLPGTVRYIKEAKLIGWE